MEKDIHIIKSIPLDFGTIELRSDNIITFEPAEEFTTFNLSQLNTMLTVFLDLTQGKPLPYFSNNYKLKSLGSEEKVFIKEHFSRFASAFAMTEESAITRFITYSFMQLSHPDIPVKMFKTKEEAIVWLRMFNN